MTNYDSPLRQYLRYPPVDLSRYRKFVVAGRHVGWVAPAIAQLARAYASVFAVDDFCVSLVDRLGIPQLRSRAMAEVLDEWRSRGLVPGWRDEFYPVNTGFGEAPLLLMERAATPLFGVLCHGVNVNGLVKEDGGNAIWIARRAQTKAIDPGMLDVIVGGGQPHNLSLMANLIKECAEEAGIPEDLAKAARPCGLITLMIEAKEGLRVGLQFNFDLELPADFRPNNADGEVAEFMRWPIERLLDSLSDANDFMFDVALVMIDLLVRKGAIGPDHADYLELVAGLRRPLPFQYPPSLMDDSTI